MIDQLISELVAYGLENGLIDDADKVYVSGRWFVSWFRCK